jgi:hypothetical protein
VTITPDGVSPSSPKWLRDDDSTRLRSSRPVGVWAYTPCSSVTDAHGRAALPGIPIGSARAEIRLPNSVWTRRVSVPADGAPVSLVIPAGMTALRVVNAKDATPVVAAQVEWSAGGSRIEGRSSGTGDVLLEGVPDAHAHVIVRAHGYTMSQLDMPSPTEGARQVTMEPLPDTGLHCRLIDERGDPVRGGVVIVTPEDPLEPEHAAASGATGHVNFSGLPRGRIRVVARVGGQLPVSTATSVPAAASVVMKVAGSRRPSGGRN